MDAAVVWLTAMAGAWYGGLANLLIRSDALPKQGGDGLKGSGCSVGRSTINDGRKGEWEDVVGLAGLV